MIHYREPFEVVASLKVKDLERAKRFYSEILGFERGYEGAIEHGWLEMNLPIKNFTIGLSLLLEGEVIHGSTTLNIGIKNAEETKQYLEKNKVDVSEISTIPNIVKTLFIFDSEGNKIVFVENIIPH